MKAFSEEFKSNVQSLFCLRYLDMLTKADLLKLGVSLETCFKHYTWFESVVLLDFLLRLDDILWLQKRFSQPLSASPRYAFLGNSSAVTFWCLATSLTSNFFIMSFLHAAVTNFNCIVVENFVKFLICCKMFCC